MAHAVLFDTITRLQQIRSILFLLATGLPLLIFVVNLFYSLFDIYPHLPREEQAAFRYNFAIAIKILTTCAIFVYLHGKEELSARLAYNVKALVVEFGRLGCL
jgi:hypothetical protein